MPRRFTFVNLDNRKDGKYMAENLENQNTQANAEPTAEELSEVLRVRRESWRIAAGRQ